MPIKSFDFAKGRTVDLDRRRAIVGESDEENTNILIQLLKDLKIQFLGKAQDERRAAELVRKFQTGMLFLDLANEKYDAFALLAKVRAQYPEMNVILTSKEANKDIIAKAVKCGAAGFLLAPYQLDALSKLVKRLE